MVIMPISIVLIIARCHEKRICYFRNLPRRNTTISCAKHDFKRVTSGVYYFSTYQPTLLLK